MNFEFSVRLVHSVMLVPYPARSNRTIFILVATALPGIGQYTYVETLTEYGQGVMNVTQPKLVFYNDKKTPQTNFSHLLQQYTVKGNILIYHIIETVKTLASPPGVILYL